MAKYKENNQSDKFSLDIKSIESAIDEYIKKYQQSYIFYRFTIVKNQLKVLELDVEIKDDRSSTHYDTLKIRLTGLTKQEKLECIKNSIQFYINKYENEINYKDLWN